MKLQIKKVIVAVLFAVCLLGCCLDATPALATGASMPPGLVSWWKGEGNATDATNRNNGILYNGAGFTSGEVNQAFNFNGNGHTILFPVSSTLNVGVESGFSIEMWVKPVAWGRPLVEWNNSSAVGTHLWLFGGNGRLLANLLDTSNTSHIIQSTDNALTLNVWQHIALTYDKTSGVACLYRNGVLLSQQILGSFTPRTGYNLWLGHRPSTPASDPTRFYSGAMDEVSLYSRPLNSTEIQSIYNAGTDGKVAVPYIVTKTADTDGTCAVGDCSLREAIKAANNNPGADTITFNIAGAGVQTIQLDSALTLSDADTTINGYSQPGASANTLATSSDAILKIEVKGNGNGTNVFDGFTISGANCTITGLSIINCSTGVRITGGGATGNKVTGNYIGINADGGTALANSRGVFINGAPGNTIGGTTAGERNIISGNSNSGVTISGSGATGNVVKGNYLGTAADGSTKLANYPYGVFIDGASSNTIGGTTAGERNVISGNAYHGVLISRSSATGNKVTGNY